MFGYGLLSKIFMKTFHWRLPEGFFMDACSLLLAQSSINGVGLTKPLITSLNRISKHSSHLRIPSKGGRGEVGITGYQPNIDAW